LDIGQCNDAYSAVKITQALANAFGVGVNDLPLSLVLSWYEQKAVAILLSLLYLGIKDIRLGPSLPAFITPNILNVLVEKFNIMPIKTADEDLKEIMKN
jgi:hydroxylamine reductase